MAVDDLIGFGVFCLVVGPLIVIALLFVLLSRQVRYQQDLSRVLQDLQHAIAALNQVNLPLGIGQAASDKTARSTATASDIETLAASEVATVTVDALPEPVRPAEAEPEKQASVDAWDSVGEPAPPSDFELAAKRILQEVWNWIVVGEGHRPVGVSMEYAIASNWLLRIGVLILVTGIGFFLKYSIDNGLLGEQARVALSVLTGVGMIVAGVRVLGGQYHLFALGLLGGGIAVLYFAVFAAYAFYHLLPVYPTFALMIAVTGCAATLAVRLDAMLVAVFAILGGYATPILLSTGQVNFIGLYSYMLLLGCGILAINAYKQWHLLNFLSFVCHYLLFFGSLQAYQSGYFWQVFPFLLGFFALYSTMVILFCLVNRSPSSLLDLLALLLNAAIFFATAAGLISRDFPQIWLALLSATLAGFYLAHAYYCLLRRIVDKALLLSFIGLAAFFLTVTLPLLLSAQWLTACWALQAALMLWLSGKLRSAFLQQLAYAVYALVVLRYCFLDLPAQYAQAFDRQQSLAGFVWGLLQRAISLGIPIAALAVAYRLTERPVQAGDMACPPNTDVAMYLQRNGLMRAIVVLGCGIVFVALQLELHRSFGYLYPPLQLPMLTLVWLVAAWLLLLFYQRSAFAGLLTVLAWLLGGLALKLLFVDLPSWQLTLAPIAVGDGVWTLRYAGAYSFQLFLMRLLDFTAVIAFLGLACKRLQGAAEQGELRKWLAWSALLLLFVSSSLEVNSLLYHFVPGLRSGGVSILWSAFALASVFSGIKLRVAALRWTGLALFALVAWKVFFIDLARLEQLYRIVAFILLGLLALGGAFFYMRYQQSFTGHRDEGRQQ